MCSVVSERLPIDFNKESKVEADKPNSNSSGNSNHDESTFYSHVHFNPKFSSRRDSSGDSNNNSPPITKPSLLTPTSSIEENSFDWKKWAKIAGLVIGVALVALGILALLAGFSILFPGAVPALAAFVVGGLTIAAGTTLFLGSAYSLRRQALSGPATQALQAPTRATQTLNDVSEQAEIDSLLDEIFHNQDDKIIFTRSDDTTGVLTRSKAEQHLKHFKDQIKLISKENKMFAITEIENYLFEKKCTLNKMSEKQKDEIIQILENRVSRGW